MRITIPVALGGNGTIRPVAVLNDTGSSVMTLFSYEAHQLGWQPALFPAQQIQIQSAYGISLQPCIRVLARVYDYNGSAITDWFGEWVVLRNYTGIEIRLSGANVRNHLYIGTAPRLPNVYMAQTKTHLARILPRLNQLPLPLP